MIQTWILRQDQPPIEAIKNDDDKSVCGDCPLRGTGAGKSRACYVNVGQAPTNVWKAYRDGGYRSLSELRIFAGRAVRLGSYGDPAAVPIHVVADIAGVATGHTGYTHQWRTCDQRLREYCMASADCIDDYVAAKRLGWRVFRVRPTGEFDRADSEAVCPASAEQGFKLTCDQCLACSGVSGGRRGDVVVSVHGSAAVTQNFDRAFKGIPLRIAA